MVHYIYSLLMVLGICVVALILISAFGHRGEEGSEVKSVRSPEALRPAA
jgi:hypothetical protein